MDVLFVTPNSAKKVFSRPYLTDHVFMRNLFSNKIKQKNFVFIGWRTSNLMSKEVKKAFQERLSEYVYQVKSRLESFSVNVNCVKLQ